MNNLISDNQQAFEAEILQDMFAGFAKRELRYAVLRNHEFLPYSVGARDIDLVVHPEDLTAACATVTAIVDRMGLSYGNYYADERLTQFALVHRDAGGNLQQIKIDFFIRSEAYGIEILSAEDMLCDLRTYNGIPVVSELVQVLDKWIFTLLVGRTLHEKYDTCFAAIANADRERLKCELTRFLPAARSLALVDEMAEGRASYSDSLSRWDRINALIRLWARQKVYAVPRSLRFALFRLRDRLRPHGLFISVSGPDGSGKTTVIDLVIIQLGAVYGEGAINYAHFRPTVLPRIAEVAKRARAVKKVDEDYERPHRAKPSGFVGSATRLVYYWLDYMGGYIRSVRPVLRRREVMLYDRYYFDMIADSFRSRISLPMPVLLLMGHILPLPQFAFFIQVEPEEIRRRKQELTLEKIIALNERYGDLVQRGWLVVVENNGRPEDAAAAIVDQIVADRHRRAEEALR